MDELGLLVKALIQENPYELLVENKKYIEFANVVFDDGDHSNKALHALLEYAYRNNKCPESINTLTRFVVTNPYHIKEFSKVVAYDEQLKSIEEDDSVVKVSAASLIDEIYQKAYTARTSAIYEQAGRIASGSTDNPYTKERGPAAAQEYIAEESSRIVVKSPPQPHGELVDNLDYIEKYIDDFIIGDSKRVYTGLEKIDSITLIGRKQRNRWIGILGYTHHGKSLLLMTLLYNMACHGANVLLVPRESSVEEAWMTFVWLHHSKVCPESTFVERSEWMRSGAAVGTENHKIVKEIIRDLKEGSSLPGKIYVEPCKSWEEIEAKLKATNKKNNYDVLAIDYFAHLDTDGGNKRESDIDKYKKALRKAQMLSLDGIENDKSGLVIITPLQANRKGYEEVAKQNDDESRRGVYENLNAVEYFTQAAQDMDCVMSVWFEGDSCKEVNPQQMIVHCLKARGNMRFPTHRLGIHPKTGLIYDLNDSTVSVATGEGEHTADTLADVSEVLYTKTSVEWGM